ncbi:MAG: DNA-processing protein DprA [Bacteroidia bacterium]|nr:DNA-processing protein DprA [Bacteroidia bacterium]MDW8158694.1 DNA-processing protein DprA [Bacteroidia bacterium]
MSIINDVEIIHLLALQNINGIGPYTARNLIAYCGSVEAIFQKKASELEKIPSIGFKLARLVTQKNNLEKSEKEYRLLQSLGITVHPYFAETYPNFLKNIPDAPILLYQKGPLNLNTRPSIAIVGTRKPTEYGKKQASFFAEYLASQGINIVSGLAYGIDSFAHMSTLKANGTTTAVLAHGFSTIYPASHKSLAEQILGKGALITEYSYHKKPKPMLFPERNRIIAGLCVATIVVEAAVSGGALITAKLANDYNREVYAIPGNLGIKTSEGCNQLIRKNLARILTHPQEVIDDLEINGLLQIPASTIKSPSAQEAANTSKINLNELSLEEQKIYRFLASCENAHIDTLHEALNLPIAHLATLLLNLEFLEIVESLPGKKYRIKK